MVANDVIGIKLFLEEEKSTDPSLQEKKPKKQG